MIFPVPALRFSGVCMSSSVDADVGGSHPNTSQVQNLTSGSL